MCCQNTSSQQKMVSGLYVIGPLQKLHRDNKYHNMQLFLVQNIYIQKALTEMPIVNH